MNTQQERILAAIDVGTNSVHMVIVKIQPSFPSFVIIAREKETVRLGNRHAKTGNLKPAITQHAIDTLDRFQMRARSLHAEQIMAVATSAVREAPNGREFLQHVKDELGLDINLISGIEEARRIYLGVLSGMEFHQNPHVLVDIGGGSTELVLGTGHEPQFLSSTKVGAVRLTSEFVSTDPINDEEFLYLQAYVRGMLERPVDELRSNLDAGITPRLVGTSGTIETLAMVHAYQNLGSIPDPLNGYEFSQADLHDILRFLKRQTCEERAKIQGIAERRAEIIVAGALILAEVMHLLGVDRITVCERALREGVIVDWMLNQGLIEDRLRYQSSVRQRSVMMAAHKFHVNLTYAHRVANFALSLFDQLQGVLHSWSEDARALLWAAALLHNCGHYISHSAHHKHSYYLIRHSELLGYTESEIEVIANLARYHRKSGPKKTHENYRNLVNKNDRLLVMQLYPILRLAVAFDRRQLGAVESVICEYDTNERCLVLKVSPTQVSDDCALEIWSLDYKKSEFERIYEVSLKAELVKQSEQLLVS